MSRHIRVQRVQECVVDLADFELDDGEDPRVAAVELAIGLNDWDTVDLSVEEGA